MNFFARNRMNFALWALALLLAVPVSMNAQMFGVGPYGALWRASAAADTATLTINQSIGLLTGTPTAAANYTTPTATQMCNAFPTLRTASANYTASFAVNLWIKNTSGGANTITLVAGTGVTATGTKTAAQNTVRHFIWQPTSCVSGSEAWNIHSLEVAAF